MSGIETQKVDEELIGGFGMRLDPAAIEKPFDWSVIEYERIETEWGTRFDIVGVDNNGADVVISSWNIAARPKIKVSTMVGKKFSVQPFNEKKVKILPL